MNKGIEEDPLALIIQGPGEPKLSNSTYGGTLSSGSTCLSGRGSFTGMVQD